jgi:hypothetical protein
MRSRFEAPDGDDQEAQGGRLIRPAQADSVSGAAGRCSGRLAPHIFSRL